MIRKEKTKQARKPKHTKNNRVQIYIFKLFIYNLENVGVQLTNLFVLLLDHKLQIIFFFYVKRLMPDSFISFSVETGCLPDLTNATEDKLSRVSPWNPCFLCAFLRAHFFEAC